MASTGSLSYRKLLLALGACLTVLVLYPDDRSRLLLQRTAWLAGWTAVLATPCGCLFAWIVTRTNVPARRALLATMYLGMTIPLYLHATVWEAGFGQLGWYSLLRFGFGGHVPLTGWLGALWVHTIAAIPWVALLGAGFLRLSDDDLETAARIDASTWQMLRFLSIRQLAPAATITALWVFVWVAGEMTVTDIFGMRTYAEEIYTGFALDDGQSTGTAPLSQIATLALVAALALVAWQLVTHVLPMLELNDPARRQSFLDLGRWRWPSLAFATALVFFIVVVPVINLVAKAGWHVRWVGENRHVSWSAAQALRMTTGSLGEFRREFGWSLAITQLSSLATLVLAACMAYRATRRVRPSWFVLTIVVICLALPGPLVGVLITRLFSALPGPFFEYLYSRTVFAPCLALSIKSLPLVFGLLWCGIRATPVEMIESSQLAGAGIWSQLTQVVVPSRIGWLLFVFLTGVLLNLGDLAASILVVPPGVSTLAIQIFGLVHYGVEDRLSGLCLASMMVFWGLGGLCWWFWPRP